MTTSSQTALGMVTIVTMQKVDGVPAPSVVQIDAQNVFPNASGQISISAEHVPALMRAGWGLVITSGSTHVP